MAKRAHFEVRIENGKVALYKYNSQGLVVSFYGKYNDFETILSRFPLIAWTASKIDGLPPIGYLK